MDVGQRIKQLRGEESQAAFSDRFRVSVATLSRYEVNKNFPDIDFIAKLCKYYNVSSDWIIFGSESHFPTCSSGMKHDPKLIDNEFITVPIVAAELSAGNGRLVESLEVIDHLAFKRDWIMSKGKLKNLVLMTVRGDSMEPIIQDHDLVLIDLSKNTPYPGSIFAVGFDGVIYLKRLYQQPGKLVLHSESVVYKDIIIDLNDESQVDSIQIIGRAIWWCHDEIVRI